MSEPIQIDVSKVTLDPENARVMFTEWYTFHLEQRQSVSVGDFDYHTLVHTDAEWIILHPIEDADGGPLPPTSRFPAFPAPLAHGATHVQASVYASLKTTHREVLKTAAALKTALIASIGKDIADELRHPITGLANVPYWDILQHVKSVYGTINRSDVSKILSDINTYHNDKPFQTNAARLARHFAMLGPLGMYTSEMDKIEALQKSVTHLSIYQSLFSEYFRLHPDIFEVSFNELCKYVVQQLPHATAQAANYTHNSESELMTIRFARLETEFADFRLQANAASVSPHAGRGGHGGRQADRTRTGRGGPGRGRSTGRGSPPARDYCFHHGYRGHNGRSCDYMQKQGWDPKFLDASRPTTIDGFPGSTFNA